MTMQKNILGPIIKDLRKERNMTQNQLSELTGYKQNTISQHEGQKRELSENDLATYSKALNVTPQYLYDRLNANDVEISEMISSNKEDEDLQNKIIFISKKLSVDNKKEVLSFMNYKLKEQGK